MRFLYFEGKIKVDGTIKIRQLTCIQVLKNNFENHERKKDYSFSSIDDTYCKFDCTRGRIMFLLHLISMTNNKNSIHYMNQYVYQLHHFGSFQILEEKINILKSRNKLLNTRHLT